MVWRAEQSPLYQSVERFNSGTGGTECGCKTEERSQTADHSEKQCRQPEQFIRNNANGGGNMLQRIMSDKDALLIVALILLLWHEKADMKIIAALAFVLLG